MWYTRLLSIISIVILLAMISIYLHRFFKRMFKFFKVPSDIFSKRILVGLGASGFIISLIRRPVAIAAIGATILVCFFISCVVFDIIGYIYIQWFADSKIFKYIYSGGLPAVLLTAIIIIAGIFNAYNVHMTEYTIDTDKLSKGDSLRIALIGDVHLGVSINPDNLRKYAKEIENENPDLVLLAGDMFDEGTKKDDMEKACEYFGNINSTYGVYFVYGNHDIAPYNRNSEINQQMVAENLEKNEITILEDSSVLIDDSFYLIGRNDAHMVDDRESADELLSEVDITKPVIVLDHQPLEVDILSELGVDLHLSGHTHGGQIFPTGIVAGFVYDNVYGSKTIDDYNSIVTSGIGTWSAPIRIGGISEYVMIDLIGTK